MQATIAGQAVNDRWNGGEIAVRRRLEPGSGASAVRFCRRRRGAERGAQRLLQRRVGHHVHDLLGALRGAVELQERIVADDLALPASLGTKGMRSPATISATAMPKCSAAMPWMPQRWRAMTAQSAETSSWFSVCAYRPLRPW